MFDSTKSVVTISEEGTSFRFLNHSVTPHSFTLSWSRATVISTCRPAFLTDSSTYMSVILRCIDIQLVTDVLLIEICIRLALYRIFFT